MEAEVALEQALEYCLDELTRTGRFESGLRRYPQYVDQLRPLLELAQTSRVHYRDVPEAPSGLQAGRERMLAAAAQQRARGVPVPSSAKPVVPMRQRRIIPLRLLTLTLSALMVMIVLGGGLVWAASDSLPRDRLYPVKIAVEDVRLALASSPADNVELVLEFVEERTVEIQAVAAAGRRIPDESVDRLEQHIERALTQAADAGDAEVLGLLGQIQSRVRNQAKILERVEAPLMEQPRLERAAAVCRRGAEEAEQGLTDPKTFRERDELLEPLHREEEDGLRTPAATPQATHQGLESTSTPEQLRTTAVPQTTPTDSKPTATHQVTPQGPRATATNQRPAATATPLPPAEGPEATATRQGQKASPTAHAPPQSPGATEMPQSTQSPAATPGKPREPSRTQPPGDGKGSGA